MPEPKWLVATTQQNLGVVGNPGVMLRLKR
jgi:hypothetical protein